jgi:D-arabinose 1-dehydrogenase-like Zn-dependent alcohol dehydrogenase
MRSYKLTQFGAPLSEVIESPPAPKGAQVLVRVSACGVCHSDLHIADGYLDLGQGQKLDLAPAVELPRILGHEIVGVVEELGPEASGVKVGDAALSMPGADADAARNARRGTRMYAPSRAASAFMLTAGSAIMFWSIIQDIWSNMNPWRRRSRRPSDVPASQRSAP